MKKLTSILISLFEQRSNCEVKKHLKDWQLRLLVIGYQDKGKTLPESLRKWVETLDDRRTRYFYRICRKKNIKLPEVLLLRLDQLLKDDECRYMRRKKIQYTMEQADNRNEDWFVYSGEDIENIKLFLHVWDYEKNHGMTQTKAVERYWKTNNITPDMKAKSKVKAYQKFHKLHDDLIDLAISARKKNPDDWIESILRGIEDI